jgi:lysozyme family protein
VPWYVIGILHALECNCDFSRHLHNGDPLMARTRQIPAGRPQSGTPPFTWAESAADALRYDGFTGQRDWDVAITLERFEKYNGLGYKRKGLLSPYLWSMSNHYIKGKYTADGMYDPDVVSRQVGAAVLLRKLT